MAVMILGKLFWTLAQFPLASASKNSRGMCILCSVGVRLSAPVRGSVPQNCLSSCRLVNTTRNGLCGTRGGWG